jgi:hypothetical protein
VTILNTNPYIVTASFEFAARTAAYSTSLGGIMLATTLAANFADAGTVDAVPVDLVTTTKTGLATMTEANFFRCINSRMCRVSVCRIRC